MPNYDYECPQCAHRFEIWQNVGDAPPPCPECNAETKKVFQVPRIIFKGSGFYVTDKRSESQSAPKSESAPKPESVADAKSEASSTAPASAESSSGAAKSESVSKS